MQSDFHSDIWSDFSYSGCIPGQFPDINPGHNPGHNSVFIVRLISGQIVCEISSSLAICFPVWFPVWIFFKIFFSDSRSRSVLWISLFLSRSYERWIWPFCALSTGACPYCSPDNNNSSTWSAWWGTCHCSCRVAEIWWRSRSRSRTHRAGKPWKRGPSEPTMSSSESVPSGCNWRTSVARSGSDKGGWVL